MPIVAHLWKENPHKTGNHTNDVSHDTFLTPLLPGVSTLPEINHSSCVPSSTYSIPSIRYEV
jgi:hypothetical protein